MEPEISYRIEQDPHTGEVTVSAVAIAFDAREAFEALVAALSPETISDLVDGWHENRAQPNAR
jgi:hypothetical protein